MKIATLVYCFLLFRFLYPFCVRYFHAPLGPWVVGNLALVMLWCLVALTTIPQGSALLRGYRRDFGVLLLLVGVSALLNSSTAALVAKSLIEIYLPGMLLFQVLTRVNTTESERSRMVGLCYLLIVVQIPVSLGQYFLGGYPSPDSNSGTVSTSFGGSGVVAVLEAFLIAMCITLAFDTGRRYRYLLAAACGVIPIVLGGARFGLVLVPVVALTTLVMIGISSRRGKNKGLAGFALTVIAVFVASVYLLQIVLAKSPTLSHYLSLGGILDPSWRTPYESQGSSGRTSFYGEILRRMGQEWYLPLFGLGSAAIEQSRMSEVQSMWPAAFDVRLTSGITFFAGLGLSGLWYLGWTFAKGLVVAARCAKAETSDLIRRVAVTFVPTSVASILSSIYTDVWSSQIGLIYWVLLATMVTGCQPYPGEGLRSKGELDRNVMRDSTAGAG